MLVRTIAIWIACLISVTAGHAQAPITDDNAAEYSAEDATEQSAEDAADYSADEADDSNTDDSSVALSRSPASSQDAETEARLIEITEQLGYVVMPPERVEETLNEGDACKDEASCDLSYMRSKLGVDTVAMFRVEADKRGRKRLVVRTAGAAGTRTGSTALAGPDSARAIETLLMQVLGREDPAPATTTVLLTTVPIGAMVSVDKNPPQEAPARFQVPAGRHRIRGELEGYRAVVEEVDIPAQQAPFAYQLTLPQSVELSAAHVPNLSDEGPTPRKRRPSSAWNYILATALGLGAAGLTTYAVLEARRDGECVAWSSSNGVCTTDADTGVAVIGAAVGASVSALAAAGLLIFQPLRVEISPEHAKIRLSHHF